MSSKNSLGSFAKKIAEDNVSSPLQEKKGKVIKPVEAKFLISIEEDDLYQLKRIALDQKTNVRNLIRIAIKEKYIKK